MKRRDILKLATSAAVVPAAGIAQQRAQTGASPAAKPERAWAPSFFDLHQHRTVIALVDLIIPATDTPGAKAALVDRHMDHLLAASPEDDTQEIREGLGWLDGYAIRTEGKPFERCASARQVAMLKALDAGEPPDLAPGHRFFQRMKQLTAQLYYATEIGFNELNKGGRVPKTFACEHPEHP
jgi:hypothetical protein